MKMRIVVVGSAVMGMLAASAFLDAGVAYADAYAGQKYSDASKAAGDAKQTVVVAARFGDHLAQDDCVVERSQGAPFADSSGVAVADTVQFYLNCNGGYATATTPGTSLGSQEGRDAKAAADKAAADQANSSGSS